MKNFPRGRRRTFRAPLLVFFVLAVIASAAVFGVRMRHPGSVEYRKFSVDSFDAFDTLITFTAFARDEAEFERYAGVLRGEMTRLHRLFDIYNDYDGLANMKTINDNAGGAPVTVGRSITDLLEIAKDAYGYTDGAINLALGPVLSIWHDRRETRTDRAVGTNPSGAVVPTLAELRAAAVHVSPDDIVIDRERSTVFLRHGDMRLDVGALAKGYAAREAAELLKKSGLRSGMINAGGNVVVIGRPLDGRDAWSIGVRSPTEVDEPTRIADVLYLTDSAAVTSGSDQRYFEADGRRYHHIIDPATLFPAESAEGVTSVTVIHPDSAVADILSTAAFILPIETAMELITSRGAEAIWLTEDGKKPTTPGYTRLSGQGRNRNNGESAK